MLDLDKQISHLEERHAAKGSITSAAKLALRYWQASRFSFSETYARTLLQRANHTMLTATGATPPMSICSRLQFLSP